MKTNNANKKELDWWNSLSLDWKYTLIQNVKYADKNKETELRSGYGSVISLKDKDSIVKTKLIEDMFINLQISNILEIQKLTISYRLAADLSPVFKLTNLKDFYIVPPTHEDSKERGGGNYIYIYPKQLRSKVKELIFWQPGYIDNLNSLKDFINLELIEFQACHIYSLDGIERLKKLKSVTIDQGSLYSDLSPLKDLKLEVLDIPFTEVCDFSPLEKMITLEYLHMDSLAIDDIAPILKLPNLTVDSNTLMFKDENKTRLQLETFFKNNDYSYLASSLRGVLILYCSYDSPQLKEHIPSADEVDDLPF